MSRAIAILSFVAIGCAVYDQELIDQGGPKSSPQEHVSGGGGSAGQPGQEAGGSKTTVAGATGGSIEPQLGGNSGDHAGGTQLPANGGGGSGGMAKDPEAMGGSPQAGAGGSPGPVLRELASARPSTALTSLVGRLPEAGNDSSQTTSWSASTTALPQWWQVDLGDSFTLQGITVRWEYGNVAYTYSIDVSSNGADFKPVLAIDSGIGPPQTSEFSAGTKGRYVRINTTKVVPENRASIYEVTIRGF